MINLHDLRLVGAALYWGEGTKVRKLNTGWFNYAVEFTNVDGEMINVFLNFLRKSVGAVETRIKAQLFLYPEHNDETEINYWINLTNIPRERFQKIIHIKERSGRYRISNHGIMKIRYFHKKHFLEIQGIIGELRGGV